MRPETQSDSDSTFRAAAAAALLLAGLAACGGGSRNRAVEADAVPLSAPPTRISDDAAGASAGATDAAAEGAGDVDGARAGEGSAGSRVADAGAPAGAAAAPDAAAADGAAGPASEEVRPTGAVSWPRGVDGDGSVTIARVGGQDIALTDMVSKWMLRDPDGVRAILDDLILSQVVKFEAGALGIELPEGEIDRVVRGDIDDLAEQAKRAGAPNLERFIQARLGIDAQTFVDELGREAAIDLLAPRCVRAWILASERREFRIIAVEDEAAVREVQSRLDAGEAFADVARALSIDPTKDDGGRMAPVVRSDQPLAQIAFATEIGGVSEPVEDAGGFVLVHVESAPAALEGEWPAVGAAVEASLAERPVEDPEYWQWKDAMFERYEIDISPFLELLRSR